MKLYATTTSERASKGQGGNDKLEIHLTIQVNKVNKTLADITVLPSGTIVIDETELSEIVIMKAEQKVKKQTNEDIEIEASKVFFEKGKQKKGQCNHESTLSTHDGVECADCHLPQNKWNIKGKQKKGDRLGLCHCGYPCLYGTDYCERHQTP